MVRSMPSPETALALETSISAVFTTIQRKFDQIYCFWRSAARPGRQPGRAHHPGPWQVHPDAGDEHFQNKYEKMVSEDALR
jgi:hypothetical protein